MIFTWRRHPPRYRAVRSDGCYLVRRAGPARRATQPRHMGAATQWHRASQVDIDRSSCEVRRGGFRRSTAAATPPIKHAVEGESSVGIAPSLFPRAAFYFLTLQGCLVWLISNLATPALPPSTLPSCPGQFFSFSQCISIAMLFTTSALIPPAHASCVISLGNRPVRKSSLWSSCVGCIDV